MSKSTHKQTDKPQTCTERRTKSVSRSISNPTSPPLHPKSKIVNPKSKIPNPITSIGDLVADLIVSIPTLPAEAGQHQVADDIRLEPGGGANFLIAGARLGYPMAAIGALGDDEWGHRVAEMIRAEGVDLSGVKHNGTTTTVIVLVSQSGDHVFLGKYGHGSKITLSQPDSELIKRSGGIYGAGYTLSETRLVDLAIEAMFLARQSNIPVFFDPGPQMAAVSADVRDTVLPLVSVVLATEEELPFLVESGSVVDLMTLGPQMVVVKKGQEGCQIYTDGRASPKIEAPGYPVPVVDTSAAGDSFNAAFIAAMLWGWALPDCAKLANAVGAAKVQKLGGGRNVPTPAEVRHVIEQFEIGLRV